MDNKAKPNGQILKPNCNSGVSSVSSVVEASGYLRDIAGFGQPGEKPKEALRRVQTKLHRWSWNRLYSIWRKSDRVRLSAEEMDELRRVAGRAKAGNDERDELLARIERLETALMAKDPALYRPQIDVLQRVASRMCGED